MKMLILVLGLLSLNAFADETYRCNDVQRVNGWHDSADLTLKTSFFSGSIKGASMITADLKGSEFEDVENPFTDRFAERFEVDAQEVKKASKLKFKQLRKSGLSTTHSISVSESMLNFSQTGYVHYYYRMCILGNCESSSYYFKCDKI